MAQDRKNGNSDKSMTAVEWLIDQLKIRGYAGEFPPHLLFEQAKQMMKEQIVEAYVEGINLVPCDVNSTDELDAEKYYHKTFGK